MGLELENTYTLQGSIVESKRVHIRAFMYYGFMVFVDNQYLESDFQKDKPTAGPRPVNFKGVGVIQLSEF